MRLKGIDLAATNQAITTPDNWTVLAMGFTLFGVLVAVPAIVSIVLRDYSPPSQGKTPL